MCVPFEYTKLLGFPQLDILEWCTRSARIWNIVRHCADMLSAVTGGATYRYVSSFNPAGTST